jgi:hypothetical protein
MPDHKFLWYDSVKARLGEEGYPWFVDRAERHIAKCPVCKGTGLLAREPKKTDLQPSAKTEHCRSCAVYISRLGDFTAMYFYRMPPAYRNHTLGNLLPYAGTANLVSLERQQTIINKLKESPECGWSFFGPPHVGKTTWTTALYTHNLWQFFMGKDIYTETDRTKVRNKTAVWRIKAKALLDQYTDWSGKRFDKDEDGAYTAVEPDVTPEKIIKYRRLGVKSKLYLEEIDKINMTEARSNNLFEVLDTLHEEEGIVVLNSNLTPEEFTTNFGEQLAWRLQETGKTVNLFET